VSSVDYPAGKTNRAVKSVIGHARSVRTASWEFSIALKPGCCSVCSPLLRSTVGKTGEARKSELFRSR
jgi:hypothetical protein